MSPRRSVTLAVLCLVVAVAGSAPVGAREVWEGGGANQPIDAAPPLPMVGPEGVVTARVTVPYRPATVDRAAPARLALPPGKTAADFPLLRSRAGEVATDRLAETEEWRVDDGTPALVIANLAPGPDHGLANRFDPSDFADCLDPAGCDPRDLLPPRPLRIRRIHFWVNGEGEPTGPMEWHIWEDNGGHKADDERDIVPPFTVTGAPGQNVIDLTALGVDAVIDPPRLFQVGVANKVDNETSPDILLDDGAPYVGGSGDFHASATGSALGASPDTMFCGLQEWVLLSVGVQVGGQTESRSPVWMIWLDVEWLAPQVPPEELYFERLAGDNQQAGDFAQGSRIAWGDYDGDGWEDILESGSRIYRNNGDATFTNVTTAAGITDSGNGGLWADYDNDGDLDFYQSTGNCVPCGHERNLDDLWRNNGDGTFTNVRNADYDGDPAAPVPGDDYPTEGIAWSDVNRDGYLDLYAANHVNWDDGTCYPDYLWLNEGPPTFAFRDASAESGIRRETRCGRGVNPADFNDDRWPDIYVSNYRLNANLLWVNKGPDAAGMPSVLNEARKRGVEGVFKTGSFSGAYGHTIGSVWGDLDRDLDLDLIASNLAHSAWLCFSDTSMVYRAASENDTFEDVRAAAGVEYVETHSDPSLVDFDNDGYLDLHITHVYDGWRSSTYRNVTAEQPADETGQQPIRFANVTHLSGIYPRTGWGSGWADMDQDGDLDLAARGLWRNRATDAADANHWLQVKVVGCGLSNRDAIGARALITTTDPVSATTAQSLAEIVAARGTGSQDSRVVHFGLGAATAVDQLQVTFPSRQVRLVENVSADQRITVTEVGACIRPATWTPRANRPVTLHADTCGQDYAVTWDLDGDGVFDDGSGTVIEATFRQPNPAQVVAVQVTDGSLTTTSRAVVEVREDPWKRAYVPYVSNHDALIPPTPTPTATRTPVPTVTPLPTPTREPTGRIVFSSNRDWCPVGTYDIYTMRPDGSDTRQLTDETGAHNRHPAFSLDGHAIAFVRGADGINLSPEDEIYVMASDGAGLRRLTQNSVHDGDPDWSPDGTRIVFESSREPSGIYVMNADGSGQALLAQGGWEPAWSPDGKRILFTTARDDTLPRKVHPQLYIMNADGSDQTRLLDDVPEACHRNPAWSADGSRIAFERQWVSPDGNERRGTLVYTANADGSHMLAVTSESETGFNPSWSPDGTQIALYRTEGIFIINADGSGVVRRIPTWACRDEDPDWN